MIVERWTDHFSRSVIVVMILWARDHWSHAILALKADPVPRKWNFLIQAGTYSKWCVCRGIKFLCFTASAISRMCHRFGDKTATINTNVRQCRDSHAGERYRKLPYLTLHKEWAEIIRTQWRVRTDESGSYLCTSKAATVCCPCVLTLGDSCTEWSVVTGESSPAFALPMTMDHLVHESPR